MEVTLPWVDTSVAIVGGLAKESIARLEAEPGRVPGETGEGLDAVVFFDIYTGCLTTSTKVIDGAGVDDRPAVYTIVLVIDTDVVGGVVRVGLLGH